MRMVFSLSCEAARYLNSVKMCLSGTAVESERWSLDESSLPMATLTQRIPHWRRPQIFRDHGYAAIEAALADDRPALWLKHIMHDLARAIRKMGGRYVGGPMPGYEPVIAGRLSPT
jgi:hypothetical protein